MLGGGAEETGVDTTERHNDANPGDADPSDLEVALDDKDGYRHGRPTGRRAAFGRTDAGEGDSTGLCSSSIKDYLRMTKAEQALKTMVGIAKGFAGGNGAGHRRSMGILQRPRRRFPVDLATLDTEDSAALNAEEAELGGVSEDDVGSDEPGSSRATPLRSTKSPQGSGHKRRPWTPGERRRLRNLKAKGWDDERIGLALGGSSGAVLQQWRKQK